MLLEPVVTEHKFRMAEELFIFPETRCPFCNDVIRSRWIWQIKLGRLAAVWNVTGRGRRRKIKKIVITRTTHPHVYRRGQVCLGSTRIVSDALFNGLNPGSPTGDWTHHTSWKAWLKRVWKHDCGEAPAEKNYYGTRRVFTERNFQ